MEIVAGAGSGRMARHPRLCRGVHTMPTKVSGSYLGSFLVPLVLLGLMGIYFLETLSYPQQEDVGPAAVPYLWMAFCGGFCVFLAIMAALKKGISDPVAGRVGFVAVTFLWLSLYLVGIQTIGYFVSSFVFLAVSIYALGYRNLPIIAVISAGWLIFSYFVFFRLLYIPLPVGPILKPVLG